jgi:predicted solute-binding protein
MPLSSNHRRAITSVMLLLDELVCRSDDLASGRAVSSVLYRERNGLSDSRRTAIGRKSREIRSHLAEIVEELDLSSKEKDLATALRWQSSSACDYLHEIGSRRLRAYGPVPAGLARYLDDKIGVLIRLLKEMAGE